MSEIPNKNRRGMRLTGTVFGSHLIRRALEEMLACFYNPTITVKSLANDGTNVIISEADIQMGPLGWKAEIDLTNGQFGGATGQTMLPALIYNIENLTNPNDSQRCLQIRDFNFGYRPKLTLGITAGYSNRFLNQYGANYETIFEIAQDLQGGDAPGPNAQPTACTGGTVQLQKLADTAILPNQQIIFADFTAPDVGTDYQASFFVQITDDGTNLYATLYGRMWNNNGRADTQQTPWPTGENILALGSVRIVSGVILYDQVQVGHALNRYPAGTVHQRGRWLTDNLANNVFYNGDLVLDDSQAYGVTGTQPMYYIWRYTGTVAKEVNPPSFFGGPWTKQYAVLLP